MLDGLFCEVNAITTLAEFLLDCASDLTRADGERAIARFLDEIEDPCIKSEVETRLSALRAGKRDLIHRGIGTRG